MDKRSEYFAFEDPTSMDESGNHFDGPYAKIPAFVQNSLLAWVNEGRGGGHFITAILENDLKNVFARGDEENVAELRNIVMWLYNRSPMICWGDPERVKVWAGHRGLKGLNDKILEKNT